MVSVSDVLAQHAVKMVDVALLPEDRQRITVRRRHIWNDAKRALQRPSFEDKVGLNITFIGEQAHDAGGPLREFFRLLWQSLSKNCSLFSGQECKRILAHNVTALQQQEYLLVGRCIALALLYGGGAPHFFSEAVVSYLLDEPINESAIDDIPEQDITEKGKKVCSFI